MLEELVSEGRLSSHEFKNPTGSLSMMLYFVPSLIESKGKPSNGSIILITVDQSEVSLDEEKKLEDREEAIPLVSPDAPATPQSSPAKVCC